MAPDPIDRPTTDDENQGEDALTVEQQEALDEHDRDEDRPPGLDTPMVPPD
jgi:hypothetical protein